jgi:porin
MQLVRSVSVEKINPVIKLFAFLAVILAPVIAFAENPQPPPDNSGRGGETMMSRLWKRTADSWHDFYSKLNERGVTLEFNYTGEAFHSFELQPNSVTPYRGLINLTVSFDTEKLGLWPHVELFIQGQNGHGKGINISPGGIVQPISNIDARNFTQISEYGFKQDLLNGGVQIILGKKDVNLIFCANEYGNYLVNPSYALIPTVPMPTFPAPALGAALFAEPLKPLSLGLGFYDGSPKVGGLGFDTLFDNKGGHFLVFEPAWKPNFGKEDRYPGDYRLGFWYHSGAFQETGSSPNLKTFQGNYGFYVLMNQVVYKGNGGLSNDSEFGLFIQFGWSPNDRNSVTQYIGTGFRYKGVLQDRHPDTLGLGMSYSWLVGIHGRTELTNIELFYVLPLTSWMSLQPDIQYFHHLNGDRKNGLSAGLRWLVGF